MLRSKSHASVVPSSMRTHQRARHSIAIATDAARDDARQHGFRRQDRGAVGRLAGLHLDGLFMRLVVLLANFVLVRKALMLNEL